MQRRKDMETASVVISIITSVITAGTLIYKLGFKNDYAREKRYYKKVLKPFMKALTKNENMNVMEKCKELVKRMDDDVPKYVVFLIKENSVDDLKKVMICDYFDIYENDDNKIRRIIEIIGKLSQYIGIALMFFLMFCAYLCFMTIVYYGISVLGALMSGEKCVTEMQYLLLTGIMTAISVGTFFIIFYSVKKDNMDRYTTKKDKIEKMIKNKTKYYDKNQSKLIY